MIRKDQKRFVRELSRRIADDLCNAISEGRIPQHWDGHELRTLLAYRFNLSAAMSLINREPRRRRARDYRATVLQGNL